MLLLLSLFIITISIEASLCFYTIHVYRRQTCDGADCGWQSVLLGWRWWWEAGTLQPDVCTRLTNLTNAAHIIVIGMHW